VKYLDPVRDELAQLRDAAEHWRTRSHHLERELDLIRDTLAHRTEALQRIIDRPCPRCANSQDAPK
jgi:hypothetical protein